MDMKSIFVISVSVFTLLVTFDTVWLLASFLTYHPLRTRKYSACSLPDNWSYFFSESIVKSLLKDALLSLCFIFQHTIMAHINMKLFLDKMGIGVLSRSIYVVASCVTLQTMMHFWQHVDVCVWSISANGWSGNIIWNAMAVMHVISWFMVYGGCLLVDVGELIGAKQVLYYVKGFPDPLKNKSEDLIRYYKHMRHPSFIGFSLILMGIPQMSLDRFILAIQLILYMFVAWRTDARDICYLRSQLADKEESNGDWHHHSYQNRRAD